jgi:hypothetical protein
MRLPVATLPDVIFKVLPKPSLVPSEGTEGKEAAQKYQRPDKKLSTVTSESWNCQDSLRSGIEETHAQ